MKLWGLVSISWFYCYIMFGACVPEVTQTTPLRANTGLCFLFTRVNAVLFSVTGPRGARWVHAAYSFGSDTWDSGAPGGAHPHPSSEWWWRPSIAWKAAVEQTLHIHCLRLWLLFHVCRKIKKKKKAWVCDEICKVERQQCFTTVCYRVKRCFLQRPRFRLPSFLHCVRFNEGIGCFMKSISHQINLV